MPVEDCKKNDQGCVSRCIQTERGAGKPQDQAVAICLNNRKPDKLDVACFNNVQLGEINIQEKDGVEYIVAPVTMIVEGVLNNAYYPREEMAKNVDQWNGKPLPIGHPVNEFGVHVMANTPENVAKYSVGQVWNTRYVEENGVAKLVAEAWINIERAEELSPELIERLQNNERIEVSTGLFTDAIIEEGTFNKQKYEFVVFNFRPDHLAILLDEVGACSNNDGCGLSLNSTSKFKLNIMRATNKVKNFFNANEASFRERRNSAEAQLLRSVDLPKDKYLGVREVFMDKVVFGVWGNGQEDLYQLSYTMNESDDVVFEGQPVRVKEKREFVSVETEPFSIVLNSEGSKNETPKIGDSQMGKEELVNKLIANSTTPYTESMKDGLMAMSEEDLKGLIPADKPTANAEGDCGCGGDSSKVSTNKETQEDAPTVNSENDRLDKVENAISDIAKTLKELPNIVANTVKEQKETDQRGPLVESLKAFNCDIEEEELNKMSVNTLKKLVKDYGEKSGFYGIGLEGGDDITANGSSQDAPEMMPLFPSKAEEN